MQTTPGQPLSCFEAPAHVACSSWATQQSNVLSSFLTMIYSDERYAKGDNLNDEQDDGANADDRLLAQRLDPLCGRISPTNCMPYGDSVVVSIILNIRLFWLGLGTSRSV